MTAKKTSAIILAAGLSSRLGMPKLLLEFNDGTPFIHHIIKQYRDFGCEDIWVVINPSCVEIAKNLNLSSRAGVKIAVNQNPEAGRFGSIRIGLEKLQIPSPVFIHNVDNPFAHRNTLEKLIDGMRDFDFANPVFNGKGGHPVLTGQSVARSILESGRNEWDLSAFLKRFSGKNIDVDDPDILWNINTPGELKKFRGAMAVR